MLTMADKGGSEGSDIVCEQPLRGGRGYVLWWWGGEEVFFTDRPAYISVLNFHMFVRLYVRVITA